MWKNITRCHIVAVHCRLWASVMMADKMMQSVRTVIVATVISSNRLRLIALYSCGMLIEVQLFCMYGTVASVSVMQGSGMLISYCSLLFIFLVYPSSALSSVLCSSIITYQSCFRDLVGSLPHSRCPLNVFSLDLVFTSHSAHPSSSRSLQSVVAAL